MAAARSSRKHPEASRGAAVKLLRRTLDAVIFDMDGVVTRTAVLHAAAWKQLFDEFLQARAGEPGSFRPFDIEADYRYYVDGKPRYDGVASFLASRDISLPYGSPDDPPDADTVCGLGNRKDAFFQQMLKRDGVEVYESTVRLIRRLKDASIKPGIFSASRNAGSILAAAGIHRLFDAKVDGLDAEKMSLAGKPSPETLLELARRLGASPARTAVVEDAIAGVQAGRAGDFALVIGVNRSGKPGTLLANGADIEVSDLSQVELSVDGAEA
jgi:alpha,alpha-trehalase